jgi:hypothetical protein
MSVVELRRLLEAAETKMAVLELELLGARQVIAATRERTARPATECRHEC